jgi:Tfp pilus assembly protein FimV
MLGRPRWGRWILLVALAATPGALFAAGGREAAPAERTPPLVVTVEYGDSLWTIARKHGDPERDVRALVAEIRRANGVDPGRLQPGSEIVVPVNCLPERDG